MMLAALVVRSCGPSSLSIGCLCIWRCMVLDASSLGLLDAAILVWLVLPRFFDKESKFSIALRTQSSAAFLVYIKNVPMTISDGCNAGGRLWLKSTIKQRFKNEKEFQKRENEVAWWKAKRDLNQVKEPIGWRISYGSDVTYVDEVEKCSRTSKRWSGKTWSTVFGRNTNWTCSRCTVTGYGLEVTSDPLLVENQRYGRYTIIRWPAFSFEKIEFIFQEAPRCIMRKVAII